MPPTSDWVWGPVSSRTGARQLPRGAGRAAAPGRPLRTCPPSCSNCSLLSLPPVRGLLESRITLPVIVPATSEYQHHRRRPAADAALGSSVPLPFSLPGPGRGSPAGGAEETTSGRRAQPGFPPPLGWSAPRALPVCPPGPTPAAPRRCRAPPRATRRERRRRAAGKGPDVHPAPHQVASPARGAHRGLRRGPGRGSRRLPPTLRTAGRGQTTLTHGRAAQPPLQPRDRRRPRRPLSNVISRRQGCPRGPAPSVRTRRLRSRLPRPSLWWPWASLASAAVPSVVVGRSGSRPPGSRAADAGEGSAA